MNRKADKKKPGEKVVCRNKKARHDYNIEETLEAGLVLTGTEVKALRAGQADIKDAWAVYREGELFLVGAHISPYEKASHFNHEPRRDRKLLVQKKVIEKVGIKLKERGFTLIPLELYFSNGWAKVLLGLGKGRKQYDNRQEIRAKTERREMREAARDRS